jgi:hypothetical protein
VKPKRKPLFERHDDLMQQPGFWTLNLFVVLVEKYAWGGIAIDVRHKWKRGPALVFLRWRGRWPKLRPNLPGGWTITFPWFKVRWREFRSS